MGRHFAHLLESARVPRATEPNEVVVLRDYLIPRPREVERERRHVAAQVVDVKDQIFREIFMRAPNHPTDSGIHQAVLVARDVDRLHERQAEVPLQIRIQEGSHETAASRVDVHRNVVACLCVVLDQRLVNRFNGLEGPRVGHTKDRNHRDGIFVDEIQHALGRDRVLIGLHVDIAGLYLPVSGELLPNDLHVAAHDDVGLVGGLALRFHARAPSPLQRHAREHDRFRRADRGSAHPGFRCMEEPRHDVDAAFLDLGRVRIFVLVDQVLVEALRHQLLGLRFHPSRHERCQVESRIAVQHQLVVNQVVRDVGIELAFRELVLGDRVVHGVARIDRAQELFAFC